MLSMKWRIVEKRLRALGKTIGKTRGKDKETLKKQALIEGHKTCTGAVSANIGNMPLNCLIFQDNIAKMNWSMADARKGAKDIGRMLESPSTSSWVRRN